MPERVEQTARIIDVLDIVKDEGACHVTRFGTFISEPKQGETHWGPRATIRFVPSKHLIFPTEGE